MIGLCGSTSLRGQIVTSSEPLTSPEDTLITKQLFLRPARHPDLAAELQAFHELSEVIADDPDLAVTRFLDLAISLCPPAGSAGLSELAEDGDGNPIFSWTSMRGVLAPFQGGSSPRHYSPCGLCLDQHHTVLFDRPARAFGYLANDVANIVEVLIVPIYDTGKRPLGALWIVSHDNEGFDATDARVMEQLAIQLVLALKLRAKSRIFAQLEQVSRDNALLVEEVHHRVKNTIQMAAGFLTIQARTADSLRAQAVLSEAQSRLMVMAKVHEALHQPSSVAGPQEVDLQSLLQTLCSGLQASFPDGADLGIHVTCEPISVESDRAIPIGLIVNEAVTNAIKHAFPDDRSGVIRVDLSQVGSDLHLCISDNGIGVIAPRREGSLGMQLIKALARRIGGTVEVISDQGTTVRTIIPICSPQRQAVSANRPSELSSKPR